MKLIQIFIFTICCSLTVSAARPMVKPVGYEVETIEIPKGITLGVGGMAFMDRMTMLICTREGEVWKYNTKNGQWQLYADGLHESLGLWIDHKTSDVYVM